MPWYIRFGKVPEVTAKSELSFSFEIRNDLGDTLFPGPLPIQVEIQSNNSPSTLSKVQWTGAQWMQNVRLRLTIPARPSSIRVHLKPEIADNELKVDQCCDLAYVHGTTSSELARKPGSKAEPFALRRLPGGLEIWEETGSSIAAHVWDAGILLCGHLCYLASTRAPSSSATDPPDHPQRQDTANLHDLVALLTRRSDTPIKTIELGTGCGTSGLVLAHQFPDSCTVELTDTLPAQELIQRNVAHTQSADANVYPYALDWDSTDDRSAAATRVGHRDLVLVSDCTYNVDAIETLVGTLKAVVSGRNTLVAVALKRRHEDEARFFEEMRREGFENLRKQVFKIPATEIERVYGVEPRDIELYLYRRV